MRKIMLVIDDFNELVGLETFFRRLGFDVLSLGKDLLVSDALIRFHPEIVVSTLKGRAVDGTRVATRVKKISPPPRVVLVYPQGTQPNLPNEGQSGVDALIETPVQPRQVIRIIAQLSGLDPEPLIEKYDKIASVRLQSRDGRRILADEKSSESSDSSPNQTASNANTAASNIVVNGRASKEASSTYVAWDPVQAPGQAATARSARSDRYEQFLRDNDDGAVDGVLPHDLAAKAMQQLKKDSEKESEELDRLERDKREFATALFTEAQGAEKKRSTGA